MTSQGLHELSLLTLGPQLRGSINNDIGTEANLVVFGRIQHLLQHHLHKVTGHHSIELINASHRKVVIAFSPDPDIAITEWLSAQHERKIIAIEIKGGKDTSNIWNRLGEAEKSHQTAKKQGFNEFWTIHHVSKLDKAKAHEKSPTTTRFFSLSALLMEDSPEFLEFRALFLSLVGIPTEHQS
jgi:hypothetical protein